MNLVKASSVLYPILGENIGDIILNYMVPNDYPRGIDRPNLRKFCVDYSVDQDNVDHIFGFLKKDYEKYGDCGKAYMENKICPEHKNNCEISMYFDTEFLIIWNTILPKWYDIKLILRDGLLQYAQDCGVDKSCHQAFIADLKLEESLPK